MTRRQLIAICTFLTTLVSIALFVAYQSFKSGQTRVDPLWLECLNGTGYLSSSGSATESYVKAVSILRAHAVDPNVLKSIETAPADLPISGSELDKMRELLVAGARAKRLGIVKTPNMLSSEVYTRDGRKFDALEFLHASRLITYFARLELRQAGDVNQAISFAKANLALSIQLLEYHEKLLCVISSACRASALETLEMCAKAKNDTKLAESVGIMRKKLQAEWKTIMEMPEKLPSFWDTFRQCTRSTQQCAPANFVDHNANPNLINK